MRYLFIDKIKSIECNKSITAIKNVSLSEDVFTDHFMGYPVMPGALQIETVAQVATALLEVSSDFSFKAILSIVEKIKSKGGEFITLTHSTAIIASGSEIGEGCIICPFSMVGPDTKIGDFTIINFYSSVAHDCVVDSHCVLSPYSSVNGNSKLGKEVFLGPHSTVSSDITVGSQVKVSSGSAVMKNTPDRNLVYGVPGKYAPIF